MDNQLFGTIETSDGIAEAMLCVDEDRPNEFMIQWFGKDRESGGVLCQVTRRDAGQILHLKPRLLYRSSEEGGLYAPDQLTEEEVRLRDTTVGELTIRNGALEGMWSQEGGGRGNLKFEARSKEPGVKAERLDSWAAFRTWANDHRAQGKAGYYRGHGCSSFSLMTTLHRAGRYRLERYRTEEVESFRAHAEVSLGKRIKLEDPQEYATLIGLAQHHGVPTPLLDWTLSPYVAAFFAFSDALEHGDGRSASTHIRIYALSRQFVAMTSPRIVQMALPAPFVASLEIAPIHNPRLYAQQGRFLVTNVGFLESYICRAQQMVGQVHLQAVDIPISSARDAMQDLEFMGLTAATMYPGMDGIGRMFQHKMLTASPRFEMPRDVSPEGAPTTQTPGEVGVPRRDRP